MCMCIPGNPGFCFHFCSAIYDACKYVNTLSHEGGTVRTLHYRIIIVEWITLGRV